MDLAIKDISLLDTGQTYIQQMDTESDTITLTASSVEVQKPHEMLTSTVHKNLRGNQGSRAEHLVSE